LKSASDFELNKLVKFLKSHAGVSIQINGHTDNQGSEEHNKILSENRAKTVQDYLLKNGIVATRMTSVGLGYSQPNANNTSSEGRALNRRTEIVITSIK
jgi:outer membrane protein OmpA-like peptidoglycan-associated protein